MATGEQAAGEDGQAEADAGTATMFAVNLAMHEDREGARDSTGEY